MKSEHKAAIKSAAPIGLIGASVLALIGNPAAWAMLIYSTYRVGRVAYREEKIRAKLRDAGGDYDLFV